MIVLTYISIGEIKLGVVANEDLVLLTLEGFEEPLGMGNHFWEAVDHDEVWRCHEEPKHNQGSSQLGKTVKKADIVRFGHQSNVTLQ